MSDNGKQKKLVFKAELEDGHINIEFGKDVHSLLFDRAINLLKLQLENMIIASQQPEEPKIKIVPTKPLVGDDIMKKIRRGYHGQV